MGKATLQKAALGRTRTGVTTREQVVCPPKQEPSHLCDRLHSPVPFSGLDTENICCIFPYTTATFLTLLLAENFSIQETLQKSLATHWRG